MSVSRIIEQFGGLRAAARALGHTHPTTIAGWIRRGTIPARQIPLVLKCARRHRLDIKLEDFFGLGRGARAGRSQKKGTLDAGS